MKSIDLKKSGNPATRIVEKMALIMGVSLVSLTEWAPGDEKDELEAERAVDKYATFDLEKIEKTVKAFLECKSVDECTKLIRHAERVKPLMKSFYGGEAISAKGFESLNKAEVSYRGDLLTAIVQTADFLEFPIAVERVGKGKEATYLVDWESWTGFSELKPEVMQQKKPETPTLMRVLIAPDDYYNYGFTDEKKWKSYRLEVRNSEFTFQGYADRGSAVEKALAGLEERGTSSPFLVKVAYPRNARAKDQVEIVEVVSAGWIYEEPPNEK